MKKIERAIIQRKGSTGWKDFAYPLKDLDLAKLDLHHFRVKEQDRKFPAKLRLIKKTTEIFNF